MSRILYLRRTVLKSMLASFYCAIMKYPRVIKLGSSVCIFNRLDNADDEYLMAALNPLAQTSTYV